MKVLGLDVGGANIKAAYLETAKGKIKRFIVKSKYFPVWREGKELLTGQLRQLKEHVASQSVLERIAVTMTAELSDVYYSKREGVNHILDSFHEAFPNVDVHILNVDGKLVSVEEARLKPLMVAAANWAATGWLVSKRLSDAVAVDVGSTTTSIIPILNRKVIVEGKTDFEKLSNGELVYTGALRTNVAAVIQVLPLEGKLVRVSSELFATTGDVHLILGNIDENDYTVDTSDGRGKSKLQAMARLARTVCSDLELLTKKDIVKMAEHIWEKQIEQIASAVEQVLNRKEFVELKGNVPLVTAGVGRNFLAAEVAEKLRVSCVNLDKLVGLEVSPAAPASALALMVGGIYD